LPAVKTKEEKVFEITGYIVRMSFVLDCIQISCCVDGHNVTMTKADAAIMIKENLHWKR
jgi:hypothetical protein